MKDSIMLTYLTDLSHNNDRQWYHAHKEEFLAAKTAFEGLVQELIYRIGKTDSSILNQNPRDLTFKLVRDTRFSHDKSPYNPAFRAHISSKGKLPIPVGYYIMIKPGGQSFLGGGLFTDMFKDATAMIRDHILTHPGQWEQVIQSPDFKETFTVQGMALKNVPRGYDREHPMADYLKFKSWYLEYPVSDPVVEDTEQFLELAVDIFLKMKPFNDYLNQALEGFKMPER